jgi:hypothetical protein
MTSRIKAEDRAPLTAECLSLIFDAHAVLGELLDSVEKVFQERNDPIKKVWIEDEEKRGKTLGIDQAREWLRAHPGFRTFQAAPRSEAGNSRATWLATAIAFNLESHRKTLFLGVPPQDGAAFSTHLQVIREIVYSQTTEPVYGFGFHRPYGLGPAGYSMGLDMRSGGMRPDLADQSRLLAWSTELTGSTERFPNRHRHLKGMILDVFPMNVLSDTHLRQCVEGVELEHWIAQNTGTESLTMLTNRCFVWSVREADTTRISKSLSRAGLIMATDPAK